MEKFLNKKSCNIGLYLQQIEIGKEVYYYSYISEYSRSKPLKTRIISNPWQLGCGEIVCKIDGVAGGVSINHLSFENLPEIKISNKKLIAKERYNDFLQISDCYNITFGEYLKNKYYLRNK